MKGKIELLTRKSKFMFVTAFVVTGLVTHLLFNALAAGPLLALEPETGSVTSGAETVSDAAASGGAAVRFAAALPNSMSAVGDSITNAANISSCCSDNRQFSWSTGTDPAVSSHYRRLLAANPAIVSHAPNNARSGSRMNALDSELAAAATSTPDYVTVLMGGNDICTATLAQMTSTANFSSQFDTALSHFYAASPSSRMLVASVPNIYTLWSVLRTNQAAQATWNSANICQSMLSASNTEANRQTALSRIGEYNDELRLVCAKYPNCKFDNYAMFNYSFTAADISTVDYFHPSLSGQNSLASTLWAAGYWPDR